MLHVLVEIRTFAEDAFVFIRFCELESRFLKKLLAPSGTFPSFVPISENKWTLTITILQMYLKYVMCEVSFLSDSCIVSFTLLQGSGSCKDAHEDVFGRS